MIDFVLNNEAGRNQTFSTDIRLRLDWTGSFLIMWQYTVAYHFLKNLTHFACWSGFYRLFSSFLSVMRSWLKHHSSEHQTYPTYQSDIAFRKDSFAVECHFLTFKRNFLLNLDLTVVCWVAWLPWWVKWSFPLGQVYLLTISSGQHLTYEGL